MTIQNKNWNDLLKIERRRKPDRLLAQAAYRLSCVADAYDQIPKINSARRNKDRQQNTRKQKS